MDYNGLLNILKEYDKQLIISTTDARRTLKTLEFLHEMVTDTIQSYEKDKQTLGATGMTNDS